jgi:RecB family exonuclease
MPITLITGPANAGKARVVLDAVARHVAHGEQPLLVLPTGADADRYRRELAQEGPVTGVNVCLFAGLLEAVARCAAVDEQDLARAPLSAGAREQMLCTLAARMQDSPGTARRLARALGGAIAELQAAQVSPGDLRASLRAGSGGGEPRERMLVELHERYSATLAQHRLLDVELRARRALDALRRRPGLWRSGAGSRPAPVLFYGFDDLTGLEMDAVQTLGCVVDAPVTVALSYERGRIAFAGRAWAFQELLPGAAEHVQLGARSDYYARSSRASLHHLERRLFEAGDGEPGPMPPLAGPAGDPGQQQLLLIDELGAPNRLLDAAAGDEAPAGSEPGRAPARAMAGRPPARGVRLLQGSSPQAEAALIAEQARALIQDGFSAAEIAIVHRAPASVAESLAAALEAAGVPHAIAGRTRLADTALGRALMGLLACGWEGLDGVGEARLSHLLAWLRAPGLLQRGQLADRLEAQALRAGVREAAGARQLWERENWTLDGIDRVRQSAQRGAVALLEAVRRELMRLFEVPRAGRAAVLDPRRQESAAALQAALKTIAELQELASVDPRLLGGPAGVLDALEAAELPRAHHPSTPAVALLDPLALRARRVRVLFACGLQEGVFPMAAGADPVFSDEMRARVASIGGPGLARRQDALAAERYLLYATVSRPEELLYLSWHESGEDGAATPPSLFLDDVCDLFDDELRNVWVQELPGPAAGAAQTPAGAASIGVARPGPLREGVSARLRDDLRDREMWSASSLERWAACPMSWFIERMLHAEDLEPEPEPLARGSLAHAVLGDVLEGLRERAGSARISPARLGDAQRLMREALERREQEIPLTVALERLPVARRKLQADLDRYLRHAAEQDVPLEPLHLELSFGFEDEQGGLPPLKLADGVLLRGRIDRIDIGPGGQAVVYDYKSGRTGPWYSGARWVAQGRFQMALYMRAVSELLGLEVVGGLYQPLAGADLRARGALAADAGLELSCVRTDSVDREQLAELVQASCDAALGAAMQARAAQIESRPQTCAYSGGCMHPTICRCAR